MKNSKEIVLVLHLGLLHFASFMLSSVHGRIQQSIVSKMQCHFKDMHF